MIHVWVLFTVVVFVACYLKSKRWLNPVSLVLAWWCLWLSVANIAPTGVSIPSVPVQLLYLLMLFSVLFGAILVPVPHHPRRDELGLEMVNQYKIRKWNWVYVGLLCAAPFILYLFVTAMTKYAQAGIEEVTRSAVFGIDGESILFTNALVKQVYIMITRPFMVYGAICGIAIYIHSKNKKILLISILFVLMDSMMMLGRKGVYSIILVSFVAAVSYRIKSRFKVSASNVVAVLMLVLTVAGLTTWRLGGNLDLAYVAEHYVVTYHTGGIALFNEKYNDPDSRLRTETTYGRSTLGGIEQYLAVGLRRVDSGYRAASSETGAAMDERTTIGYANRSPITLNAFNTILYTLYLDGRHLYVVLAGTLYGMCVMYNFKEYIVNQKLVNLIYLNILVYIGVMGLFNSPLEGRKVAFMLVVTFMLDKVSLLPPRLD